MSSDLEHQHKPGEHENNLPFVALPAQIRAARVVGTRFFRNIDFKDHDFRSLEIDFIALCGNCLYRPKNEDSAALQMS